MLVAAIVRNGTFCFHPADLLRSDKVSQVGALLENLLGAFPSVEQLAERKPRLLLVQVNSNDLDRLAMR